jgi:hypothetical protein
MVLLDAAGVQQRWAHPAAVQRWRGDAAAGLEGVGSTRDGFRRPPALGALPPAPLPASRLNRRWPAGWQHDQQRPAAATQASAYRVEPTRHERQNGRSGLPVRWTRSA